MGPANVSSPASAALLIGAIAGGLALTVGSSFISNNVVPHPVKGDSDPPWHAAMAISIFGGVGAAFGGLHLLDRNPLLGAAVTLGGAALLGTGFTMMGRLSELRHANNTYGGPYGPGTEDAQKEYRRNGGT